MKKYAIALTLTKQNETKLSLKSAVGVYRAISEEEALGMCIKKAREKWGDYSIASTAIMEISDDNKSKT